MLPLATKSLTSVPLLLTSSSLMAAKTGVAAASSTGASLMALTLIDTVAVRLLVSLLMLLDRLPSLAVKLKLVLPLKLAAGTNTSLPRSPRAMVAPLLSALPSNCSVPWLALGMLLSVMVESASISGSTNRLVKSVLAKLSWPSSLRLTLQLLTAGAVLPTRTCTSRVSVTKMSGLGALACVVSSGAVSGVPSVPNS